MVTLTKKQCSIIGIVLLVTILLIFSAWRIGIPNTYEFEYYTFSYPKEISIQPSDFSDSKEISFYMNKKIGGITYYPLSNWDDFYFLTCNPRTDTDMGAFLRKQGILPSGEDLDAYMMETGVSNQTVSLWEKRSGISREHFLFFTKSGSSYDVWFYCDELDDSQRESTKIIVDTFQLEESI